MPSSHTSFVFSLTFILACDLGLANPITGLSLMFSMGLVQRVAIETNRVVKKV